ncbi:MAG TPA: FecR family protein [Chitinophagaceae bacterium]|nr:FecR family protein [Chitinophagaceae bacterium]
MLSREKFTILLGKYATDNLSPEERSELFNCIKSGIYDDLLSKNIENNLRNKNIEGANLPPQRSAGIVHKILSSEKQNSLLIPKKPEVKKIYWAGTVAAAVIIAIIFSVFLLKNSKDKDNFSALAFAKNMEERTNTSGQPLKIEMEDGSFITLQPGSVIHYPSHFLPGKREIFLEGEAFFEVSKNASRPFFVYNKNLVTRVLGTSFNIKMNKENKQVEVSVRSGRVEVYEFESSEKANDTKKNRGVILLPNQKVIYDQETRLFVPTLVDNPLPVITDSVNKKTPAESFVFEETPIKKVIESFEKTFEIDIVVENENMYNCLFTGDVSRQDLYTRLNIICQAIQASYEIKETKILIKGTGCN